MCWLPLVLEMKLVGPDVSMVAEGHPSATRSAIDTAGPGWTLRRA
jgi:hypothetical protein